MTYSGALQIAIERRRQKYEEGWSREHDDNHAMEELAFAAVCYVLPINTKYIIEKDGLWPWDFKWWKPTPENRIKELVKAGALIAAEIDRLQRLQNTTKETESYTEQKEKADRKAWENNDET